MTVELSLANLTFGLLGLNAGLLFMEVLLFCTSLFLMLLVLVQRGKGGGLTGALGGMGGQSAFGSKAGDAFTKITVITAIIWITLCMITIAAFNPPPVSISENDREEAASGSMTGDSDETEDGDSADTDPANADSGSTEPSDADTSQGSSDDAGSATTPDSTTAGDSQPDLSGPEDGGSSDPDGN